MLGKKLLTVACVMGMLLFGGCFWMGAGTPAPPAPPPLIDLQGVHRIEVAVSDASPERHIEPVGLGKDVVERIRWNTRESGIKAEVQKQSGKGDAVLTITILSVSSAAVPSPRPPDYVRSMYQFKVSAALTRQDGRVIWQEAGGDYSVPTMYTALASQGVWKADAMSEDVYFNLSDRLVQRMLFGTWERTR
jgi:hypothetical protein